LREWCERKEVVWVEGHVVRDHLHMRLSIPPKLSVAYSLDGRFAYLSTGEVPETEPYSIGRSLEVLYWL
jgi:REP element-mobilizing transposase RayT